MSQSFFNAVRPSRIAGGLLLWSALLALLQSGSFAIFAAGLGIALLIAEDSSLRELLRAITLLWCVLSVLLTLPAVFIAGLWLPALQSLVLATAVGALMLDRLSEETIAILTLAGFGILFF